MKHTRSIAREYKRRGVSQQIADGMSVRTWNVVDSVTAHTGISLEQMQSKSRKRPIVIARQIAMTLIYRFDVVSTSYIGELFNRDHSTVTHSRQQISDLIDVDNRTVTLMYDIYASIVEQ